MLRCSMSFVLAAVLLVLGAAPACSESKHRGPPGGTSAPLTADGVTYGAMSVSELSGLVLWTRPEAPPQVVGVGDELEALVWAPPERPGDPARTRQTPTGNKPLEGGSDFEAVTTDSDGRLYALREATGFIDVYEGGPDGIEFVHRFVLDNEGAEPVRAWRGYPGRHGEGLVVLGGDRFLIANQKKPVALVAVGPPGATLGTIDVGGERAMRAPKGRSSRLVVLGSWTLDDKELMSYRSINDLAWGPGGQLYVVGSKPRSYMARIGLPLALDAKTFSFSQTWELPVRDKVKAEALTFLPDGRPLIGWDTELGRTNIVIMPPLP